MYIIITGPECSGKSTLVSDLSKALSLPFLEEKSRLYLHAVGLNYTMTDLLCIASAHYQAESLFRTRDVLIDTDVLTIEIWLKEVFGKSLGDLSQYMYHSQQRHYLLCKPNIPYQADAQRSNPHDRDRLFDVYLQQLESLNLNYSIIDGGTLQERLEQALVAVDSLL